ncbi:MAG: permease prefix domain 2-containing transporter [Spirosomataceae bacterium]
MKTPPRFAEKLLEWFCAPHLLEEVQGDLHERFQRQAALYGERIARRQYVWNVLSFIRPFALKRLPETYPSTPFYSLGMIRNNLKIAFRHLAKNRVFSAINIGGLAIGLACCMTILLYVHFEWSFDQFHSKAHRIYRVNKTVTEAGKNTELHAITPGAMAPALTADYPEIEKAVRVRPWFNDMLVSYQNTHLKISDVVYADAAFFEIFDFPLVQGDRKTVLTEPYTAVVTEETAHALFGNESPIGKTLITLYNIPVKVTGVAKNSPENSHLKFKMLISWSTTTSTATANAFGWMNNWITQVLFTYVLVREDTPIKALEAKLNPALFTKYLPERKNNYFPYLQALSDIHLNSEVVQQSEMQLSKRQTVYALAIIAFFILLIACFNFINLSTAGSLQRAKEVGMRKVLGAMSRQLLRQYFSESLLTCLLAACLAVLLTRLALPYFNHLTETRLTLIPDKRLLVWPILLILTVAVLAGLYPALHLTDFQATDTFKSTLKNKGGAFLRKSLVVVQFTLSILLIAGTMIVSQQTHFLLTKNPGFDKDQLLVLRITDTDVEKQIQAFTNDIRAYPSITHLTFSNRVPGQGMPGYGIIPEGHLESEALTSQVLNVDYQFFDTYNIKVHEGRTFNERFKTDSNKIVVNEAFVRFLGWKEAVGKKLELIGELKGEIVGVVKDFHVNSAHSEIKPLAMFLKRNPLYATLKIRTDQIPGTLTFLERNWKIYDQKNPFDYFFLDDHFRQFYKKDLKQLNVLEIFTGLAILVACLGLLGLVIHTAQQRTKEIGIRKVLGATVVSIITMLSTDFIKLIAAATVISLPVAWWAMNEWLLNFAYHIEVEWWIFLAAGLSATLIALLTVSYQAIKAALANPVKSLRTE